MITDCKMVIHCLKALKLATWLHVLLQSPDSKHMYIKNHGHILLPVNVWFLNGFNHLFWCFTLKEYRPVATLATVHANRHGMLPTLLIASPNQSTAPSNPWKRIKFNELSCGWLVTWCLKTWICVASDRHTYSNGIAWHFLPIFCQAV